MKYLNRFLSHITNCQDKYLRISNERAWYTIIINIINIRPSIQVQIVLKNLTHIFHLTTFHIYLPTHRLFPRILPSNLSALDILDLSRLGQNYKPTAQPRQQQTCH